MTPFLAKLRELCKKCPASVAAFAPDGKTFEVHDPDAFQRLLKEFYKGTLQTFVRQLHFYGFKKTDAVNSQWSFSHPKFAKDNLDEILHITRKTRVSPVTFTTKGETTALRDDFQMLKKSVKKQVKNMTKQMVALHEALNGHIAATNAALMHMHHLIERLPNVSNAQIPSIAIPAASVPTVNGLNLMKAESTGTISNSNNIRSASSESKNAKTNQSKKKQREELSVSDGGHDADSSSDSNSESSSYSNHKARLPVSNLPSNNGSSSAFVPMNVNMSNVDAAGPKVPVHPPNHAFFPPSSAHLGLNLNMANHAHHLQTQQQQMHMASMMNMYYPAQNHYGFMNPIPQHQQFSDGDVNTVSSSTATKEKSRKKQKHTYA